MSDIFVVRFSDIPRSYVYAPYLISWGFSEQDLLDGAFSEFGKILVMWECSDTEEAEQWAEYLRSRV